MFDIGTGELGLIAIIALLVLGPERLPRAARTTGALLRKARQSWQSVRAEIERELAAEELKRSLQRTAADVDPGAEIESALRDAVSPASEAGPSPAPPVTQAPTHEQH
jgi:sec-independent protein translocase protein TatB